MVRRPTPVVSESRMMSPCKRRKIENMNIPAEQPRGRTSPDEYGRDAESDCARAMAEIERVLRELALTRRSSRERLSPANEASNAPSLVPAPSPIDQLVLDAGLDFVFHKDGMIELTEADFGAWGRRTPRGSTRSSKLIGAAYCAFPPLPRVEDRFSAICRLGRLFLPRAGASRIIWKAGASVVASGLQPSPGNP